MFNFKKNCKRMNERNANFCEIYFQKREILFEESEKNNHKN